MPLSKLEKFFYNKETEKVPIYAVKGDPKRISWLSLFRKGIVPSWEDTINSQGGEFQITLNLSDKNFELANELWEALTLDLLAQKIPSTD